MNDPNDPELTDEDLEQVAGGTLGNEGQGNSWGHDNDGNHTGHETAPGQQDVGTDEPPDGGGGTGV